MTLKGSPFIMETIKRKVNKPNTTHMEDTVFALKQTIAKLRHESHAKDGVITCLKQDIVDLQDKLSDQTAERVYYQERLSEITGDCIAE